MNRESHVRRSPGQVAAVISDILADAGADLGASLPDGWIAPLIRHLAQDKRFRHEIDFDAIARAAGIANVHRFVSVDALRDGFDAAFRASQPTTVVLELDPPNRHHESPPFDGPELKYRFGRALERQFERKVLP